MTGRKNNSPNSGCTMWSDGVCVYLVIKVRNSLVSKIALLLANLIAICVVIIAVVLGLVGMVLVSLLVLAFLTRYSLWNFWGEEHLIINTASFSYSHHYGFIRTSLTTKQYHKGLRVLVVNQEEQDSGQSAYRLCFTSYDTATSLPVELYQTSFYVDDADFKRLADLINDLFVNDTTSSLNLPQINLN